MFNVYTEYKDCTIYRNVSGYYVTRCNEQRLVADTLAGLKKLINKALTA